MTGRHACGGILIALIACMTGVQGGAAQAADVTFVNALNGPAHLHMRIGSVETHPDDRGSSNTVIAAGMSLLENVGDGDIWFAYGNQQIGGDENPELCNAAGGATVNLDGSHNCYVDN